MRSLRASCAIAQSGRQTNRRPRLMRLGTSAYASAAVCQTAAFDYERQPPSASDPTVPTSAGIKARVLGVDAVIALWNDLGSHRASDPITATVAEQVSPPKRRAALQLAKLEHLAVDERRTRKGIGRRARFRATAGHVRLFPGLRSSEGAHRRHRTPGASPRFASSEARRPVDHRPPQPNGPRPWFPENAGTRQAPPQARSAAQLSYPERSLGCDRTGPASRQTRASRHVVDLFVRAADVAEALQFRGSRGWYASDWPRCAPCFALI
jgi:hypothetical protein